MLTQIPPSVRRIYFNAHAVGSKLRVGKRYYIPGKVGAMLSVCAGYKLVGGRGKFREILYIFKSEDGRDHVINNYNPWIQAVHHRREVCEKNSEILSREIAAYLKRKQEIYRALRFNLRARAMCLRNRGRKVFKRALAYAKKYARLNFCLLELSRKYYG